MAARAGYEATLWTRRTQSAVSNVYRRSTSVRFGSVLQKHRSSYTNFRCFQLNKQGWLNPDFEFKPREVQVLHCLALGLIKLNMDEIARRGYQVPPSMRVIPESDMTDELRAVRKSMVD